jgi:hypothetical protein
MPKFPIGRDVFERVLWTFIAAALAPAVADGIGWIDWGNLTNWKSWLAAGATAAFTLVKALVATKIGGKSASLDPAVKLAPVAEFNRPVG